MGRSYTHPLIHKLSILLLYWGYSTKAFRELVDEIAMLMGYEALRELPLEDVEIETLLPNRSKANRRKKLAIVPILLVQGLGWLMGLLSFWYQLLSVGHIGIPDELLKPVEYLVKLPEDIGSTSYLVVDPYACYWVDSRL